MSTALFRNFIWVVAIAAVIGAVFSVAWQSRLFGINTKTETVVVAPIGGSSDAAGENNPATSPAAGEITAPREPRELEIITLLPYDAIPAIFNPSFVSAEAADERYKPDEKVLGIEINGDIRAYSVPLLSRHEIVNDTVGGVKIAVTW